MIIAERKAFAEIKKMDMDYNKIMIAGYGTCLAVCIAGGEKEEETPSSAIAHARK